MMISSASSRDGKRRVLMLGLDAENIARLLAGRPIVKQLDGAPHPLVDRAEDGVLVPGLENWDLVILGPSDMADFVARVESGEIEVRDD